MIDLYQVTFKPGLKSPPVRLICQSVEVDDELMLWIDGVNGEDPVLVPLASLPAHAYVGDFGGFMRQHLSLARAVLAAGEGELSPTIAARAVSLMLLDPHASAETALEHVNSQALDLLDADLHDQAHFWGATGAVSLESVRAGQSAAA